jgi:hypothetical protein
VVVLAEVALQPHMPTLRGKQECLVKVTPVATVAVFLDTVAAEVAAKAALERMQVQTSAAVVVQALLPQLAVHLYPTLVAAVLVVQQEVLVVALVAAVLGVPAVAALVQQIQVAEVAAAVGVLLADRA